MTVKNLILIGLILMIFDSTRGQTTYWTENFVTGEGWNLQDNWQIADNEMQFFWAPEITNFDLSAISPVILLDDNVYELTINQYLDIFEGTNNEAAQIIILTNTGQDTLWNYPLVSGNWGTSGGDELVLPLENYTGMEVQFMFRTYGQTTFDWNSWNVYDLKLSAMYDHDLATTGLSGPKSVELFEQGTWTVDVVNMGSQPMNGFTVSIFENKANDLIGTLTETEPLGPQETRSYDFNWSSNAAFNTSFYALIQSADDQFAGNNKSISKFVRVNPGIDINILVWDNDNGIQTIVSPEKGDMIRPAKGLKRVLDDAGIDYDYMAYLPDNLDTYDIVFSTMGCFCLD